MHLISGKAKAAAQYSEEFCDAVVDGVSVALEAMSQLKEKDSLIMEVEIAEYDEHDDQNEENFTFSGDGYCIDDVKGGELPMDLVREGRKSEMEGFAARRVYEIKPRREAMAKGSKVIGVRWVDTLKAGKVRSRLVAQDFNTDRGKVAELYAATPPLMAARWLCSRVASQGASGMGPLTLMTLDVSKAFLYGNVEREVFIELPDEDGRKHTSDCVGRLIRSMYGLRDAPQIWQRVVKDMLVKMGYKPLLGTQCMYVHPELQIVIVAHVDDFLVLGQAGQLRDLIKTLQKDYKCSGKIVGRHEGCQDELHFLGERLH